MAKECSNTSCTRESCEGCPSRAETDFSAPMNASSHVKHVIGIISGKGGVGKSTATAMLAVYLRRQGYTVGILDADITGPSIPRMFGVKRLSGIRGEEMIPAQTVTGIKIMSVNLLMEDECQPVIWRGPVLGSVIKQFWTDTVWGDIDYLLVDMPPGTGDVALTVFQSLPVDGVYLVTTPQSLVEMIVTKAYAMAKTMNIPVLGVVENFSYLNCPDCGKRIELFGKSAMKEWAAAHDVPFVSALPLDPVMPGFADSGRMEYYEVPELDNLLTTLPKEG